MKVFDSLRTRTVMIVLVGLIVSNVIGYLIYTQDKQDSFILQDALDMSERAAGVSRMLRDIPESWNADIVTASDSRIFRVWLGQDALFRNSNPSAEERDIEAYVRELVPRISTTQIAVWFRPELPDGIVIPGSASVDTRTPAKDDPGRWMFVLSIRHDAQTWLNFQGNAVPAASYLPTFLALNLVTAVLCLGVVAIWLVNRITAPLNNLAHAAGRLGRDLTAKPIPETGPMEVRIAARAFNAMQARLLRQIEGRTVMLAAISHDLRTPITQIRLRTELAEETEERDKTLETLDEMNSIIGTFLDFARVSGDAEPRALVELGSLVESICDDFTDGGADVTYEGPHNLRFDCKRIAMKRALRNLIDNATTYGLRARVHLRQSDDSVIITVEDDGPGIPPGDIETVLQPFRRLSEGKVRNSEGLGLGLSIAQTIIEDHGGTLTLVNRPQGGLLVEIRLPLS
jgi:signal transduction histidine kinase